MKFISSYISLYNEIKLRKRIPKSGKKCMFLAKFIGNHIVRYSVWKRDVSDT